MIHFIIFLSSLKADLHVRDFKKHEGVTAFWEFPEHEGVATFVWEFPRASARNSHMYESVDTLGIPKVLPLSWEFPFLTTSVNTLGIPTQDFHMTPYVGLSNGKKIIKLP